MMAFPPQTTGDRLSSVETWAVNRHLRMACSVCSLSGVGAYEIACESEEELGARIPDHYPDPAPTAAEVSGQVPAARADLAQPIAWGRLQLAGMPVPRQR